MWGLRILLALVFAGVAASAALAEKRVALVIGNGAYRAISPLANPKNDAALLAGSLRQVGFDVVSVTDADFRTMRLAVRKFGEKLRAAGPDGVGLFYFAGHGVQSRGTNYLIPLDAEIGSEADLSIEAIGAADILDQMEFAENALNIVILDACRNNPYKSGFRSGSRGLTRVNAASGSLIAFAAAPGQVASDGGDGNSPYTKALAKAIKIPGLTIEQVFKKVRVAVETETQRQQTPWEESSLRGDFHFIAPPGAAATSQTEAGGGESASDKEALFWRSIEDGQDLGAYQAYLKQYPQGTFAELARLRLEKLAAGPRTERLRAREAALSRDRKRAIQGALKSLGHYQGTIDALFGPGTRGAVARYQRAAGEVASGYLDDAQEAALLAEANAREDQRVAAASQTAAPTSVSEPAPKEQDNAPQAVELAFWNSIKDSSAAADFEAYLARYGEAGAFADLARNRLTALAAAAAPQVAARQVQASEPTTSGGGGDLSMAELNTVRDALAEAQSMMADLSAEASEVMGGSQGSFASKLAKFRGLLGQVVEFEPMARFVLGQHRQAISDAEWEKFLLQYKELFLSGYKFTSAETWTGVFEVETVREFGKDFLVTVTFEKTDGEVTRVGFRLRQKPGSLFGFKIVDAHYQGISLVVTQKGEFSSILRDQGVPGLTQVLADRFGKAVKPVDIN